MDELLTTLSKYGAQPRALVRLLKLVGPALVSVIVSAFITWGTVQYVKGRDANRVDQAERSLEKTLTRDEFKTWAEEIRERLRSIDERLKDRENYRK